MAIIEVRTDMTGIVSKIDAEVGATLAQDDAIITIESMKMFIPIGAPSGGRLAEVVVGEGDTVNEGDLIARIET